MTEFAVGTSHYVAVGGSKIHYQRFNDGDREKPGLLLVHGMWAHLHWWDHIVPYFVDRFRVVAIDLGGMGDSESRSIYTARGFGEEIVAVLKDANLAATTIVAHSFGGSPAAFACHLDPRLIDRAVIVDSRLYLPGMPELRPHERRQMKVKRKVYAAPANAIERYRLIPPGGSVAPDLLRHIAVNGLREEDGGWVWKFDPALDAQLEDDPHRLIPPNIGTPIDFVVGENSEVVWSSVADAIRSYFPNAGVPVTIPGANHHILLEQPDLLVVALRGLFSRPARRAASGTRHRPQ